MSAFADPATTPASAAANQLARLSMPPPTPANAVAAVPAVTRPIDALSTGGGAGGGGGGGGAMVPVETVRIMYAAYCAKLQQELTDQKNKMTLDAAREAAKVREEFEQKLKEKEEELQQQMLRPDPADIVPTEDEKKRAADTLNIDAINSVPLLNAEFMEAPGDFADKFGCVDGPGTAISETTTRNVDEMESAKRVKLAELHRLCLKARTNLNKARDVLSGLQKAELLLRRVKGQREWQARTGSAPRPTLVRVPAGEGPFNAYGSAIAAAQRVAMAAREAHRGHAADLAFARRAREVRSPAAVPPGGPIIEEHDEPMPDRPRPPVPAFAAAAGPAGPPVPLFAGAAAAPAVPAAAPPTPAAAAAAAGEKRPSSSDDENPRPQKRRRIAPLSLGDVD